MTGRWLAGPAVAVLALAGCTTIPASSSPQVVQSVAVGQQEPAPVGPSPGLLPRDIVAGFMDANGGADPNHNAARLYLTQDAKSRWSDGAGTTIIDNPQIGNLVHGTVTVSGREIGTIDDNGVYTPSLRGNGEGTDGALFSESFGLNQVGGQWRINTLQAGLLISQAQFAQYQQRVLYFFDAAEEHLVPDPRYTQLSDPRALAQWLLQGLAQGPREGLQTALPNQTDPKRARVLFTANLASVEIPQSSQLPDVGSRDRLGAQVASTLAQAGITEMQITDGGHPVRIPSAGGGTFNVSDLATQFVVSPPPNDFYYVYGGAVYDENRRRLPGKVGTGAYNLTSVALSPRVGSPGLMIAAVRGYGTQRYLDIGTEDQLEATKLHGDLSRPAWAPDVPEVWVGDGPDLYRVSLNGTLSSVPVDTAVGKVNGTVTAVRLSPEGSRVALVLTAADHTSQIYVGSVVRTTTDVRVANLAPISPQGVAVRDVAWNDELKLFAIGTDLNTRGWGLYEVQCDGSLWTLRSDTGLPQAPDSLTVTAQSVAVVSTGPTIWRQQAGSWEPPVGAETLGTNPVYVE